jgi:hypothetical protein
MIQYVVVRLKKLCLFYKHNKENLDVLALEGVALCESDALTRPPL